MALVPVAPAQDGDDPGTLACFLEAMRVARTGAGRFEYRLLANRKDMTFTEALDEFRDPASAPRYRFSDPSAVDTVIESIENGQTDGFWDLSANLYEIHPETRTLVIAQPIDCVAVVEGEAFRLDMARIARTRTGEDAYTTHTLSFDGSRFRTTTDAGDGLVPSDALIEAGVLEDGLFDRDPRRSFLPPIHSISEFGTGFRYSPEESTDACHVYLRTVGAATLEQSTSQVRLELDPVGCTPTVYSESVSADGKLMETFRSEYTMREGSVGFRPASVTTRAFRVSEGQATLAWRSDMLVESWDVVPARPRGAE